MSLNHTDYSVVMEANREENGQFWHAQYCYPFVPTQESFVDHGPDGIYVEVEAAKEGEAAK